MYVGLATLTHKQTMISMDRDCLVHEILINRVRNACKSQSTQIKNEYSRKYQDLKQTIRCVA